jgi:hypothetical protein
MDAFNADLMLSLGLLLVLVVVLASPWHRGGRPDDDGAAPEDDRGPPLPPLPPMH